MRLDRALLADVVRAFRSPPILAFLVLEVVAGVVFIVRRGEGTVTTVLLIWAGMLCLAFFAWWAGRHRLARSAPDPVPAARPRAAFALLGAVGMAVWGFGVSVPAGAVITAMGIGGWVWAAVRSGEPRAGVGVLTRSARPFVPMLLLIALPRLAVGGAAFVLGALIQLPSGIGQQLLLLIGLFAPLEAATGRTALAAVVSALVFAALHIPLNVPPNGGDVVAAVANAVLFQASVGAIACLAFTRHRAPVPIGVAHAFAIA